MLDKLHLDQLYQYYEIKEKYSINGRIYIYNTNTNIRTRTTSVSCAPMVNNALVIRSKMIAA
jgi:hypothetical protein